MDLQISDSANKDSYLTFDHIIPVYRGGSNGFMNLQGLCGECNHKKNDSLEGIPNEENQDKKQE